MLESACNRANARPQTGKLFWLEDLRKEDLLGYHPRQKDLSADLRFTVGADLWPRLESNTCQISD